jgi:membrane-associated phospholipid phosphatase
MAAWGLIAGGYGVFLALTAIAFKAVGRRPLVITVAVSFALVAAGLATLASFWIHLIAPGAVLLAGYWLSGLFFRNPQAWFERWLLDSDRRILSAVAFDRRLERSPRWILELLEASYAADYLVIAVGAFISASAGIDALTRYWAIVLAADLACCAMLPFLRSRPPRALEPPGALERRAPALRALNLAILNRASVQANTFPSGHVAAALAAALAVMGVNPIAGWALVVMTTVIAFAAVAGRYHYTVDCVLGALIALVVAVVSWSLGVACC